MDRLSYSTRVEPIVPREKLANTLLDSTATTIYTASSNIYVEDAVILFTNRDSQITSYDLHLRDQGGSDADSNAVIKSAKVPQGGHGRKAIEAFGDSQVISGLSSNQAITATLIGRRIDRS